MQVVKDLSLACSGDFQKFCHDLWNSNTNSIETPHLENTSTSVHSNMGNQLHISGDF